MNIARDIFAYIPVKIIPALTGLISIIIIIKNLSPKEYGLYSIVISLTMLVNQIFGTWISNAVLYFLPKCKNDKEKSDFCKNIIQIQIISSIFAVLLSFFLILKLTKETYFAITAASLIFFQLSQNILLTLLQAKREIYTQVLVVGIQSVTYICFLYILLEFTNFNETIAVLALTLGFISGVLILLIINKKLIANSFKKPYLSNVNHIKKVINYGAPMCIWFFSTLLYMIGDRFIIKIFGFDEQLGQYSSFRDFAIGCASFFTMPILMASHPVIMQKWVANSDNIEVKKIISDSIAFLSFLFAPIVVGIDIFGNDVVNMVLGEKYNPGKEIMLLVILSIYISSINMHLQRGFEVTGNTASMAKVSLMVALFSIVLSFITIPSYGVLGGAVVVIISCIIYSLLVISKLRKILIPHFKFKYLIILTLWSSVVDVALRVISLSSNFIIASNVETLKSIFFIIAVVILMSLNDNIRGFSKNKLMGFMR